MTPTWEIRTGDALDLLRELPAGIAQTCITSPPYWGLRDYGTASWDGGDPACDHAQVLEGGRTANKGNVQVHAKRAAARCPRCGATRVDQQIGLEADFDAFLDRLVEVFAQVRRVLRPDGTCWINMGDSYASDAWGGSPGAVTLEGSRVNMDEARKARTCARIPRGLKNKDLIGQPWRLAFRLQADGWWLRSDIVWAKPNPMPESVKDRPSKSHEYLFLLAASERYFYDPDSVRERMLAPEASTPEDLARAFSRRRETAPEKRQGRIQPPRQKPSHANGSHLGLEAMDELPRVHQRHPDGRNRRTVWTIPPRAAVPGALRDVPAGPRGAVRPGRLAAGRPRARPVRGLGYHGRGGAAPRAPVPRARVEPGVLRHGPPSDRGPPLRRGRAWGVAPAAVGRRISLGPRCLLGPSSFQGV